MGNEEIFESLASDGEARLPKVISSEAKRVLERDREFRATMAVLDAKIQALQEKWLRSLEEVLATMVA